MPHPLVCHGTAQRLPLADTSVSCIVTSPPYYGLRVYHALAPEPWPAGGLISVPGCPPVAVPAETVCLGSEATVEAYLWHMVLVLRECSRVLRDDGSLWLNLGDSYAGTPGNARGGGELRTQRTPVHRSALTKHGLPPGSLLGIPWRVALAAQADGWLLRRDVIWEKASPMPESMRGWVFQGETCPCVAYPDQKSALVLEQGTTRLSSHVGVQNNPAGLALPSCEQCHGTGRQDTVTLRRGSWRHTASHEMVFMLTKQMGYWSDAEAVREENGGDGFSRGTGQKHHNGDGMSKPNNWMQAYVSGRNPRSVIRPAPSPYAGAHFATFPPSLVEPLIRATCPARVCTACGEPWCPVVATQFQPQSLDAASRVKGLDSSNGWNGFPRGTTQTTPHGLMRTCPCPDATPWHPGICLDPFAGTGTVGLVARALGQHSVLIEASSAYLPLARARLGFTALDVWEGHRAKPPRGETYTDLPLFA